MKLLEPKIKLFLPQWNQCAETYESGVDFCERNKILLNITENTDRLGEFEIYRDRPFIHINKFIDIRYRAWVLWHEIGHFILHPVSIALFSDSVTKRKTEREANHFASVCLLPQPVIETRTLHELLEDYPLKVILIRKELKDVQKM